MTDIALGVVGAGGRGGKFQSVIEEFDEVYVRAVCDVNLYGDDRSRAAEAFGADETYRDYNAMLVESDLDAVLIGTPMQLHVTQSIAALERDLHVLSEVPAGVGIGECRDLVAACERSAGSYMMAENYVYRWPNLVVRELVHRGEFGEPYYAEGEYLHETKGLGEATPWRRVWSGDRNGNTYPTHSLGPILRWWPDDRVARVTCAGSGHHHRDPRGDRYGAEDTSVILAKTEQDRLIKLRKDSLSERPHAMTNYQLQGTEGAYESARAPGETDRIWLEALEDADASHEFQWRDLEAIAAELGVDPWADAPAVVEEAGHGGGDYFVLTGFFESILAGDPPPIGVHEALDMTLPGLASIESVRNGGEWIDVPDSREW